MNLTTETKLPALCRFTIKASYERIPFGNPWTIQSGESVLVLSILPIANYSHRFAFELLLSNGDKQTIRQFHQNQNHKKMFPDFELLCT